MAGCGNASVLVCLVTLLVTWTLVASKEFGVVNTVPSAEFEGFVGSPSTLTAVYFHKRQLPRLQHFLKAFNESASFMKPYQVQFGRVNCNQDPVASYCDKPDVDQSVFILRNDRVEAKFPLDTMYDKDSISSNIFQVLLSSEVPVLQTGIDLKHQQQRYMGDRDIIFSWQRAIGTYEHRVFMEFAFAYGTTYRFAFATDKKVAEDADLRDAKTVKEPALWVLHCSEEEKVVTVQTDKTCRNTRFRHPIILSDVLAFLRSLKTPYYIDMPRNQEPIPYDSMNLHLTYVVTDNSNEHEAREMADKLGKALRGQAGVILLNIDVVPESTLESLATDTERLREVPVVAVQLNGQDNLNYMHHFSEDPLVEDIETLISEHGGTKKKRTIQEDYEDVPEQEVEDDVVAEAVYRSKYTPLDLTYAPALTDKTFPVILKEKPLLVVVFYLSWEARSAAFLASYSEASLALKDDTSDSSPLARVACDDWPDVCQLNNVTSYPVTKVYRDGQYQKDYKGMLETTALVNFVKLLQLPAPAELKTVKEVTNFKNLLSAGITDTVVLGLTGQEDQAEIKTFTSAAHEQQGEFLLGLVKDKALAQEVGSMYGSSVPGVVVVKKSDKYQPFKLFSGKVFHKPSLLKFIRLASLPVFPELTAKNFPSFFIQDKPFVILFGGRGEELESIGQIAATEELPVIFCQMNVFTADSLGADLLQSYAPNAGLPALVMIQHKTGGVFEYPYPNDLSKDKVTSWVRGCEKGDILANSELEEELWGPMMPGYDFLTFLDVEGDSAKQKTDVHDHGEFVQSDEHEPEDEEPEELEEDIPTEGSRLSKPEVKVHKHTEHTEL
ncbi:PREDICTED: thioredoxin domain-containing protein 16-like isoform X3 [Branchiostoma belcheri]|uniref:Thioredoxin domain-containing protein 16-like isoform X1 n=1 Tax=Branchiostoma belcheri TaxID=7741 RepID=A0A6P4YIL4_BRABE|nr:PREDICTED: thioredoxin domain-containing protein 16-like isoform X1 [Branchiostoma belcheri]XP_019629230.1 PREDICTED: thioredoxin domain-containing protein 16-like isoform X2 [Branchiostoma belcheri]XP_019629231.1 PREDICTED: thioredoxin domain-containing protein 16-like isoform X3 [Branchiostoma belcheri]